MDISWSPVRLTPLLIPFCRSALRPSRPPRLPACLLDCVFAGAAILMRKLQPSHVGGEQGGKPNVLDAIRGGMFMAFTPER